MKLLLFTFLLFVHTKAWVQTTEENQLELLAEQKEEELKEDGWLENLQQLLRHPINLNTAGEAELSQLHMLHAQQVAHLLRYRRIFGNLLHVYELQAVPGWDLPTIQQLLPYVTVASEAGISVHSMLAAPEQQLMARVRLQLPSALGFDRTTTQHFAGSKVQAMLRYRFFSKKGLQAGWTLEKDAGETVLNKGGQGFGFFSFHLFMQRKRLIKAIALGDYTINMGQGLVHWQALAFKKGGDVMAIRRSSAVLLPYKSSGEYYFNRGAAATLARKNVSATFFISYRRLDARLQTDTISHKKFFTGFITTGLHRTAAEIANRASVGLLSYGAVAQYRSRTGSVCINALRHSFSIPMQRPEEPYRLFSMEGRQAVHISIGYSRSLGNLYVFGESAMGGNKAFAVLNGMLLTLDKKAEVSLLHRHISKNYTTMYGNAFTEQAMPGNEQGWFAGIRIRPAPGWQVDGYFDVYRFPWLRYRADAPSQGCDALLQLQYQPNRQWTLYARYRQEQKEGNAPELLEGMHYIKAFKKQNLRLHAAYDVTTQFSLKTRMEAVWVGQPDTLREEGFLLYVEGAFRIRRGSVNFRIQWFDADGFNSRIYAYESDVLYSFSIPSFYDKGNRMYGNVRYDISRKMSVWLRFAQTRYSNRQSSGSGPNLMKGNTASEVKIQGSYRF